MRIPVIVDAITENGPPQASTSAASFGITPAAPGDIVDGEFFDVAIPAAPSAQVQMLRFIFDASGDLVAEGRQVIVDISGAVDADDVRDAIIDAFEVALPGVVLAEADTGDVLVTNLLFMGPFVEANTDGVAETDFIIEDWDGGELPGINLGQALGSLGPPGLFDVHIYSTAGSGVMTTTVRSWGYDPATQRWSPLGVHETPDLKGVMNNGNAIGETGTNLIEHRESIINMHGVERWYPELVVVDGTDTAICVDVLGVTPC